MSTTNAPATDKKDRFRFWTTTLPKLINYLVLVLSLGLIGFISWDTYYETNFLDNVVYMKYQLIVCIVFIVAFLYRFIISRHKFRFFILSFPFLLLSIPYLNIIDYYHIHLDYELLYYIRFVPIMRGLVALVMVVNYVTENIATTVFASYALVLLPIVYMAGLIFYFTEKHVNTAIKNLWYALWWSGMNVTTIGCYINPVTPTGMVLGLVLSLLGIIMFPLFTVYFGAVIRTYSHNVKKDSKLMEE